MSPVHMLFAAALLLTLAPPGYGQDTQQAEAPAVATPPARVAIPRAQARTPDPSQSAGAASAGRRTPQRRPPGRGVIVAAPGPRSGPAPAVPAAAAAQAAADNQRRAVPRGSRPRGDNPSTGVAVPRGSRRPPSSGGVYRNGGGFRDGRAYRSGPRGYSNFNFYAYPRRAYPYGYGGFGLGYFYYDPYRWYPGFYGSVYSGGYYGGHGGGYYGGPGGYYGGGRYGYDLGELRLRVAPRHAEVYVDGYYAGVVDDYDGIAQSLTLESGPYRIELVAPGYEPLEFNVRITPGNKVTYRGELRPRP
jgi:hypothetical protein